MPDTNEQRAQMGSNHTNKLFQDCTKEVHWNQPIDQPANKIRIETIKRLFDDFKELQSQQSRWKHWGVV